MSLDTAERAPRGRRTAEITRPTQPAAITNRAGQPVERKFSTFQDPFAVTDDMKEEGWEIEYKLETCHGMTFDAHMRFMRAQGWEPVPESRPGWEGRTRHQGLIAMERRTELCDAARKEDRDIANGVMRAQHEKFHGALPQSLKPINPKVERSYERGPSRVALDE